jgi:hypothetical protein
MTNCAVHLEIESAAYCVSCGNALCASCRRDIGGSVYCEKCLGEMVRNGIQDRSPQSPRSSDDEQYSSQESSPRPGPSVAGENPGAAFALGLIPGVGAIFNGEFFKAAVHILIFGFLISLGDLDGPFEGVFVLLGLGFYFYMPFEAYYTAKKRKLRSEGIELETPIDRLHEQIGEIQNRELWGGVALVVLGMIFLADSFRLFELNQIMRFWPLLLIGGGIWLVLKHRDQEDSNDRIEKSTHSVPEGPTDGRKKP